MTLVIDTVTVTEDRAHVRRHGKMDLSVGVTQLRIDDVSPVIADKTLRIHVENAKVGEARVVRRKVVTEPAEAHVALVREHEQRSREVEAGAANVRRLRTAIVLLDDAQRRVLTELAEDAARGMFAEGEHAVASFEAREREAYAELHVAEAAQRELERDVERLRKRLAQSGHRAERIVASIVATLSCDAPCASADVVVEYLVPGACWRPQHTATLAKDGTLTITTDACVWQNTGEDWTSALLKFSTERPSLGQKPPTLEDDELTAQRRSEVVRVEQRDVAVQHTGLGGAAPTRVPGIDDGGDVCILSGRARASVASDGRPYRVPVHEIVTKSSATLVAYPELAEAVLVRAEQANTGKAPILAGPVDLVRESGFVGRTKLALIAPGERFELGFGPDTHLRVRREFEMVTEEPGLLPTSYVGRAHRVTVHLSNLDDSARKLTVTERVPVSEMEKVEVAFDEKKTAPRSKPDDDGFVRWAVDLPPRGHVTLTMRYVLRHHKDIAGL